MTDNPEFFPPVEWSEFRSPHMQMFSDQLDDIELPPWMLVMPPSEQHAIVQAARAALHGDDAAAAKWRKVAGYEKMGGGTTDLPWGWALTDEG